MAMAIPICLQIPPDATRYLQIPPRYLDVSGPPEYILSSWPVASTIHFEYMSYLASSLPSLSDPPPPHPRSGKGCLNAIMQPKSASSLISAPPRCPIRQATAACAENADTGGAAANNETTRRLRFPPVEREEEEEEEEE